MAYSHPTSVTPEIVTVNAFLQEKIELQDALSEEMQQTLREVLHIDGASLGWVEMGNIYEKKVHPEVTVSIDTSQIPLVVQRHASARVEDALKKTTQGKLNTLLAEIQPQYERALNELWDRCYSQAIEQAASKVGTVVDRLEEHNRNLELHILHIYVNSY